MSKLYIVGTPIGNLKDITLRAAETLKAADFVACEDTRRTVVLLNSLGIKKPLTAYHKFNEREAAEKIIAEIKSGKTAALVTDAGMPCISDPGKIVMDAARENGIETEIIGGVTAFTHALLASGMDTAAFCFCGFLPEKNKDRAEAAERFKNIKAPLIFYCAPHNLRRDMEFLYKNFGDRKTAVCRELTKLYEETVWTTLSSPPEKEPRGEYVLVIEGASDENLLLKLSVKEHVARYETQGFERKEAMKLAAKDRGVAKSLIYEEVVKE